MNSQKSMSTRAWVELFLLAIIWSGSFLAAAFVLREVGVVTVVAHRVFWAALILWIFVLARGYTVPRGLGIWGAFFVMGLLNNVIPFSLMVWGQKFIESGLVSILNSATAIFGVLVAAIVFADERLTLRKILGVFIGFVGVASTIGLENLLSFDPRSMAQLAVVLGTVFYALGSSWARKTMSHLPSEVAAAGMLTGSSLVMVPAAFAFDGIPSVNLSLTTFAALGFYAVFATALAYLLYYRVLKMAGSGNLTLVTLVIPPIAILLGAVLLGERLGPNAFFGFSLVALGLIVLDGRLFRILLDLIRRG